MRAWRAPLAPEGREVDAEASNLAAHTQNGAAPSPRVPVEAVAAAALAYRVPVADSRRCG